MTEAIAGGEPRAEAMFDQGGTDSSSFLVPVLIPAGKQGKGEYIPACFLAATNKDITLSIYTSQRLNERWRL